MSIKSSMLRAAALALGALALLATPMAKAGSEAQPLLPADFAGEAASAEARYAANRVLAASDHQGLPFVIVDKKNAKMFVFGPGGRLRGASAVLLGLASGDYAVPGIGERELSRILPAERTTPAGRFVSQPGRNLQGEEVVWVNYRDGLAIHRLRPGSSQEQRAQRLASGSPADNRISLGCVVVPVAFYEAVVGPTLGRNPGVVYVLPEDSPVHAFFDAHAQ